MPWQPVPRRRRAGVARGRRQEIHFLDQTELDALLDAATTLVCRHTPATLTRAAQARALRDIECLEWKAVGERLGCSAATAIYLYRATSDAVLEDDLARVDRALYLTAVMTGLRQGRAARAALARRGLGGSEDPGRATIRPWQVPDAKVTTVFAGGADGRPSRARA